MRVFLCPRVERGARIVVHALCDYVFEVRRVRIDAPGERTVSSESEDIDGECGEATTGDSARKGAITSANTYRAPMPSFGCVTLLYSSSIRFLAYLLPLLEFLTKPTTIVRRHGRKGEFEYAVCDLQPGLPVRVPWALLVGFGDNGY